MIRQVRVDSNGNTFVAIDFPVCDEFKLEPGWAFQCEMKVGVGIEIVAVAPNGQRTLLVPSLKPGAPLHS